MSNNKVSVSRFELLMDAGFGAQKAGDVLVQAFAKAGKYVYIEPMIPAEISPPPRTRPALSGVIIRVADFDITNIGNDTDVIVASQEIVLDRRLDDEEHNPNCKVLLDMGDKAENEESYESVCKRVTKLGLNIYPFTITDEAKEIIKSLGGKGTNMYYIGMLASIYNMPEEAVLDEIKLTFKKLKEDILNKNIQVFHAGYAFAQANVHFRFEIDGSPENNTGEKILIDGNSALSMGVIDAGFKLFSGYPITPATSIMHGLAKIFPSYGGIVHQAEDEISAIGAAIGSYYAGVPAMTATSGPGLSLKQEFIGYATAAEVPIVIIDAQRSGPSTGMPTKTEQSDLLTAAFGSHGDNAKIVISVANVIDCFYAPQMARYLAEKLRLPVFIMTDFQTANSYKVITKPKVTEMNNIEEIQEFVLERFHIQRLSGPVEMVRDNQSNPGTPGGMRRITGLNTDKTGKVNYFAGTNHHSHEIRNEKVHMVQRALTEPEMFGKKDGGEILVVGWGSTRGAIEEAIYGCNKEKLPVSGMHLKIVYPLPLMLTDIFKRFKRVVTVEVAYGDEYKPAPLATLLRAYTLVDIKSIISQATGRPIRPKVIRDKAKEILNGHARTTVTV